MDPMHVEIELPCGCQSLAITGDRFTDWPTIEFINQFWVDANRKPAGEGFVYEGKSARGFSGRLTEPVASRQHKVGPASDAYG